MRTGLRLGSGASLTIALALGVASAQAPVARAPLLQVEVGDSIGLPLPDATIEEFTLVEDAAFLEWIRITPEDLDEGVHLLRFSYPGYRSANLSVPLRKGTRISLRVRLGAEPDSTQRSKIAAATPLRAIGLQLDGRVKTDIIRTRHILERDAIERTKATSVGEVLRLARSTDVLATRSNGIDYAITSVADGGTYGCNVPVMINGDQRWLFPFDEMNRRYAADDLEAAEFIPRTVTRLYTRRQDQVDCGLLVLWVRPR